MGIIVFVVVAAGSLLIGVNLMPVELFFSALKLFLFGAIGLFVLRTFTRLNREREDY